MIQHNFARMEVELLNIAMIVIKDKNIIWNILKQNLAHNHTQMIPRAFIYII